MKTELTTEQSLHLIKLGVSKVKASTWTKDKIIFRLTDLLEILPKEIFDEFLYNQNYLIMEYTGTQWHIGYGHIIPYEGYFFLVEKFKEEEIDALYELTIWCIENGHLKFD